MENIVPKFKIGDLVRHKTNTEIKMIVIDVDNDNITISDLVLYECSWIDKNGKYHTEELYEVELQATN